jgi:hypothetical protein
VPAGGRLCASHGAGENQNWSLCSDPDTTWRYNVSTGAIGEGVNVWLVDDTDTPIDFERVPIPEGATSVSVDFDGSFDTAPEMRTVRLDFPDDPESPIATATELPPQWQGWFSSVDSTTGQFWSVATDPQIDGSDVVVQVAIMTPPAGVEVRFGAAAYTSITVASGLQSVAFAGVVGDPGTMVQMLGFPEITAGSNFDDAFTIDPPAPLDSEELAYVLSLRNGSGYNVWQIRSSATTIQAPELPTDYDIDVTFPFPGAPGFAVASAFIVLEEGVMGGIDAEARTSLSPAVDITF